MVPVGNFVHGSSSWNSALSLGALYNFMYKSGTYNCDDVEQKVDDQEQLVSVHSSCEMKLKAFHCLSFVGLMGVGEG